MSATATPARWRGTCEETVRKALAFTICLIGALLPWRLRVLYSELLGWIAQGYHYLFRSLVKLIVDEVRKDSPEKKGGKKGDVH